MDAVLNWVWQGSVVALSLAVLLRLLERARANVRYAVSWAALLLVAALPVAAWLLARGAGTSAQGIGSAPIVALPDTWWTSGPMMALAWIAWASVGAAGVVRAAMRLRWARARCTPFPAPLESRLRHWCQVRHEGRRPLLVVSESVGAAAVIGSGRPMIAVAPSLLTTLDPVELDRVLIHEWAHVQRRDDLVQLLHALVRVVAGWHPAVWWIERRLRVEREIACDETTVRITGSPKAYAACLVKLAGLRGADRPPLAAPAVLRAPGLRARVSRIVSRHALIAPAWSRGLGVSVVLLLCVVSFGAAGARLVEPAALALPFDSVPAPGRAPGAADGLRSLAPMAWPAQTPHPPAAAPPVASPAPVLPAASTPQVENGADGMPRPASADPPVQTPSALEIPAAAIPSSPRPADEPVLRPVAAEPSAAPPGGPPGATADAVRSPWAAAADRGAAIGRTSKDAGVATAGFFSRFARRVAGSF